MNAGELIAELSKYPEDTPVVVWEGYNAGCVSDEFQVNADSRDGKLFLRLED